MQKNLSLMFILLCGFLSSLGEAASPKEHSQRGLAALERKDYATAAREFHQCAQQGASVCQYILGTMYLDGHGVVRNDAEGAQWVRKAAAQGHYVAFVTLGRLYEEGRGVPRDLRAAQIVYRKAIDTCPQPDDCAKVSGELARVKAKLASESSHPSSGANQGGFSTDRTPSSSDANQGGFECTATAIYTDCDQTPSGGISRGCRDDKHEGRPAWDKNKDMAMINARKHCSDHIQKMMIIKSNMQIKQECTASCRPVR